MFSNICNLLAMADLEINFMSACSSLIPRFPNLKTRSQLDFFDTKIKSSSQGTAPRAFSADHILKYRF